jgi:choline dehydrogenase
MGQSASGLEASPSGISSAPMTARREEFEYIVIGSGAGGGPVAARLARAGHHVLLLEAGGDGNNPSSRFKYSVVGANPRLDPELGWAYWVNSRAKEADRRSQHFYVPGKGLYYPRGACIGGSTAVNAMISLYPDNSDWNAIADLTGDRSWDSSSMRTYFERLESVRYVDAKTARSERHGVDGWLPMELIGTKNNLFKDSWLTQYVVSRIKDEEGGAQFAEAARSGADFVRNPNTWSAVTERVTGLVDPPRAADNGARRGTREFLLDTMQQHPPYLQIRTDCLVTRLLFDDEIPTRVTGVEYLHGPHLYGASWLAEEFSSRTGVRHQVKAAREVILSAGAFNSPQVLMLSGIGPAEELTRLNIQVRVDRPGVGRNLQDRLETGVVCKLAFTPNAYNGCTWGADGDPCRAVFDRGDPNGEYRTRVSRQMYMIRRSDPGREVPNLFTFGFIGEFRGYYYPGHVPQSGSDEFTWFTLSGHTHNTGGTVRLKTASPRDTPEINFNNFEDGTDHEGRDLEALLNGVKMARRLAASGADGPAEGEISPGPGVVTDGQLREFIKNEAWGHHASCSNKMGPASDPMAVVDSRFRVHGAEGLRVVDASVFPRIPGLFIAVPIYMISEKASDVILEDAAKASPESSRLAVTT